MGFRFEGLCRIWGSSYELGKISRSTLSRSFSGIFAFVSPTDLDFIVALSILP